MSMHSRYGRVGESVTHFNLHVPRLRLSTPKHADEIPRMTREFAWSVAHLLCMFANPDAEHSTPSFQSSNAAHSV